ncbi:sugar kinase [Sphingomonas ginkgonis]|uniref:Sugar kinase n=1 Tax=Sphingomonas ginkgonis TaxID=2315330 RepID=A0A3R9WNM9_9SPHN|nr:sugar kinase [Sphingomonas ginkgonis]RST30628.1 sugar kinase [Sphingomonas ginkgonis]
MATILCCGEGMLELSAASAVAPLGDCQLGYGGDTLNTAIHLARAGHSVQFLTALGLDPFSAALRQAWLAEGVLGELVLTHPTRRAGLYAITTDVEGERSFTYWRGNSAAQAMFELASEAQLAMAERSALLFFSLITLAILPRAGRERLFDLVRRVREHGGRVAFDGNYRPSLWRDRASAREARNQAVALANIGLPTLDDETALSGWRDPAEVAEHWAGLGCAETIVKLGSAGCRLPSGETVAPAAVLHPVDTSGAGDAFNAAYLSARLSGDSIAAAASKGHRLAGWTIMRPGATPRADD